MWEFSMLLNTGYCFEVSFKSVDQAPNSFNFTFSHVFPDIDITFACCCQEIPVISEYEHIKDFLVRVSQILMLTNKPALIAELID